jgi:hypothetical protein
MNNTKVYPWHDLAWDLALADGMDEADIERRLAEQSRTWDQSDIPEKDGEGLNPWSRESASIEEAAKTEIATKLWSDIYTGKLPVRKANGGPLDGEPGQFKMTGPETPHLTVEEGNDWLKKNRYLQVWAPEPKTNGTKVLAQPESASKASTTTSWRHQIQAEAWEYWLRLRASGCNPSVYSICDAMEKWCIAENIKGGKGQNPKAGTIRNTVLGAGHWTPPTHSVEQAKKHVAQTAQTKVAQTAH